MRTLAYEPATSRSTAGAISVAGASRTAKITLGAVMWLCPFTAATAAVNDVPVDVTSAHTVGGRSAPDGAAVSQAALLSELEHRTGLNRSDLAAMLGVSRRTLYNWLNGARMSLERSQRVVAIKSLLSEFSIPPEQVAAVLTGSDGGQPISRMVAEGAPMSLLAAHLADRLARMSPLQRTPLVRTTRRRVGGTTPGQLAALFAAEQINSAPNDRNDGTS